MGSVHTIGLIFSGHCKGKQYGPVTLKDSRYLRGSRRMQMPDYSKTPIAFEIVDVPIEQVLGSSKSWGQVHTIGLLFYGHYKGKQYGHYPKKFQEVCDPRKFVNLNYRAHLIFLTECSLYLNTKSNQKSR
jgi:hypothetical protein